MGQGEVGGRDMQDMVVLCLTVESQVHGPYLTFGLVPRMAEVVAYATVSGLWVM